MIKNHCDSKASWHLVRWWSLVGKNQIPMQYFILRLAKSNKFPSKSHFFHCHRQLSIHYYSCNSIKEEFPFLSYTFSRVIKVTSFVCMLSLKTYYVGQKEINYLSMKASGKSIMSTILRVTLAVSIYQFWNIRMHNDVVLSTPLLIMEWLFGRFSLLFYLILLCLMVTNKLLLF